MNSDFGKLKAREIAAKIHSGGTSSVEVTEYFLDRIESLNPEINAFILFNREFALNQAKVIDSRIRSNDIPSPLAGVPVAIKYNIQVSGLPTTCASKILSGHRAVYDANLIENIKKAGLVIISKTNLNDVMG